MRKCYERAQHWLWHSAMLPRHVVRAHDAALSQAATQLLHGRPDITQGFMLAGRLLGVRSTLAPEPLALCARRRVHRLADRQGRPLADVQHRCSGSFSYGQRGDAEVETTIAVELPKGFPPSQAKR